MQLSRGWNAKSIEQYKSCKTEHELKNCCGNVVRWIYRPMKLSAEVEFGKKTKFSIPSCNPKCVISIWIISSQMEIGRNFTVRNTSLVNAELPNPKIFLRKFSGVCLFFVSLVLFGFFWLFGIFFWGWEGFVFWGGCLHWVELGFVCPFFCHCYSLTCKRLSLWPSSDSRVPRRLPAAQLRAELGT